MLVRPFAPTTRAFARVQQFMIHVSRCALIQEGDILSIGVVL
jgi:hypothetical protein